MADREPDCLFCRIAAGEVASEQVYADDEVVRLTLFEELVEPR